MSKELVSKKIQRKAARRAERKLPVQPEPTEVEAEAESADIESVGIAMESDGISQR